MTIKKATYKYDNGNTYDDLYFKTSGEQVINNKGVNLEVALGTLINCHAETRVYDVVATTTTEGFDVILSHESPQLSPPIIICTECGNMNFTQKHVNWVNSTTMRVRYASGGAGKVRCLIIYTSK